MLGKPFGISPVPDYLADNAALVKRHDDLERRLADLKRKWDAHEYLPSRDDSIRAMLETKAEFREATIELAEAEAQIRRDAIDFAESVYVAKLGERDRADAAVEAEERAAKEAVMAAGWPDPDGIGEWWRFSAYRPGLNAALKHSERLRHDATWDRPTDKGKRDLAEMLERIRQGDLTRWRDPYARDYEREKLASPDVAGIY